MPQTGSVYGHGTGNAKNCEAVEDRGADLDFCDLSIEVARGEALAEEFHTMHFGLNAASLRVAIASWHLRVSWAPSAVTLPIS